MRLAVARHGRMLRSGSAITLPENASPALRDAAVSLANIAATLRTSLDAIANDQLATPRERRADSQKAVAMARESFQRVSSKVMSARDSVGASIQGLREVQHGYESKLGPIGVERIRRRADALRQQGPDAVLEAMRDFEATRDLDGLLAPRLDANSAPLRLFAKVARPQQVAQLETDLPSLRELLRTAEGMGQGIGELVAQDDPYSVAGASGNDLLEQANAQQANDRLPATWPGYLL